MNETNKEDAEEVVVTEISSERGKLVPRNHNGPLVRASKPSGLVWRNIWGKKVIDSYRGVVEAANNLIRACMDHERTKAQLEDLDVEIQTERLSRQNRLKEAKRKQEKEALEYRKEMAVLQIEAVEAEERLRKQAQSEKRKPDDVLQPKSRMERLLSELDQCMDEWNLQQEHMKARGLNEKSNEWQILKNRYEAELHRIQDL